MGAIVVIRLEYLGLRDLSNAFYFASAVAVVIFAAAHVAAFAARSYRQQIGVAIALAEFVVFVGVLVSATVVGAGTVPPYPTGIVLLYPVAPLIGLAAAVFSLYRVTSLINEPIGFRVLADAKIGLRWFLAVTGALASGVAFEAIMVGTNAIWPAYLSGGATQSLAAVLEPGIVITVVANLAPARKMVAAWATAGVYLVGSTLMIAYTIVNYIRLPTLQTLAYVTFIEAHDIVIGAAIICGVAVGLQAAGLAIKQFHAS